MEHHPVASPPEWLAARKALLVKEKEATGLRDKLTAERMALPWVKIDKEYTFDTPESEKTLADHFAGPLPHLEHHDVSLAVGFTGADGRDRSLQKAHGLAFPLGLFVRHRF
jgi:predicted dithiol-disulfide oxidoreductase (DUF899 family)